MKLDLKQSTVTLAMAAMLLSGAPAARAEAPMEEETITDTKLVKEGSEGAAADSSGRPACQEKDKPECDPHEGKAARCVADKWICAVSPRML